MNEDKELSIAGKLGVLLAAILLVFLIFLLPLQLFSGRGSSEEKSVADKPRLTAEQAAALGNYQILYKDPEDKTGRTVLTHGRGYNDGVGIIFVEQEATESAESIPNFVIGILDSMTRVPASEDFILALRDPVTRGDLPKIRIDRTKSELIDIPQLTTQIYVDDLAAPSKIELLGYAGEFSRDSFERLIRVGDAVSILVAKTWEFPKTKSGKIVASKDEKGNWLTISLTIRRIGGKETVLDDLSN